MDSLHVAELRNGLAVSAKFFAVEMAPDLDTGTAVPYLLLAVVTEREVTHVTSQPFSGKTPCLAVARS